MEEVRTGTPCDCEDFGDVVDMIPSGIGVFDVEDDTITTRYLNDGYYHMIGTTRDDRKAYEGPKVADAIFPADVPTIVAEAHAAIAENRLFELPFRVLSGDGDYRWVEVTANHHPAGDGVERFFAAYFDIDRMVRDKDELAADKAGLERILSNIPAAIGVYRKVGDTIAIESVNKSIRSVTGNPESVLLVDRFEDIIDAHVHPEDLRIVHEGFEVLFSGAYESTFTYRNLVLSSGEYRWLRARGRSFPQPDGTQVAYVVYTDVTDDEEARRSAEHQLAEERLRMRSLQGDILAASCFNVTHDHNVEINNDENLRYAPANDETVAHEAYATDPRIVHQNDETKDVLLSAAEQIPDPEQRREFVRMCSHFGMMDAYEHGEHEVKLEYRRNTAKGLIWVQTRIEMLPDPQSGDVLAFFYTSDINEQKIEQLIDQRIVSSDYEFISLIDVATRQLRSLSMTSGAKVLIPVDHEDHDRNLEHTVLAVVDPELVDQTRRDLRFDHIVEVLATQPEYLYPFTSNDPDTGRRRKQLRYSYLDDARDLIYLTGSDITESFRVEQEQRDRMREALHDAEAANAAKSDFLSRMSHDIRTPLNGIIGMTSLALDEQDPATVHGYLEKIDESGRFLLALVNDILDMSRIESGAVELHPEHYGFEEFKRYIESVIRPLCDAKDVDFVVDCPTQVYTLLIDRLRINQICFNLLSNAVKFTPRGGHVRLDIATHPVEDGRMTFSLDVVDDGIGMSEAFLEHLFEPFSQEHTAASDQRNGTGLGLAIVKQLVDLMGGTIEVISASGSGSTFRVTLTASVAPDVEVAPAPNTASESLEGRFILAAEDNDINAEIIMRLLEKQGASVTIAGDGDKAVKQFSDSEQYHFDAILMDVRMPVMDGLEATKHIRALDRPDAKDVPIIAMTANAFEEDVRDCLAAGMDSHVAKPIDPTVLFSTLYELLNRRG